MSKTPQPECPECEKLSAVAEKSNIIGEFLDYFLGSKHLVLARWEHGDVQEYDEDLQEYVDLDEVLRVAHEYRGTNGINALLAEYFNIDLNKVEQERRALLEWLREQHNEQ